jgi:choline transport protein
MSTWVAMLLSSIFSLINGGLAGTVWIYVASWLCVFTVAASLAEMSSMAPHSGGQYREFPNM